ncbi:MAG: peptidylprolyl isomerase [Anaeromyxobacteraceae bacterium]
MDSIPASGAGRRALVVTAVVAAVVSGGVGFALGRAGGGGSPLDGRPSGGAVLARFDGEKVTAGELDALAGPKDAPLRAQLADPAARKEFVEGWTRTLLLARRAEAKGFHRTHEFVRSYAQELSTAFVEKELEESSAGRPPSDDELRGWFNEHETELQRPERVRLAIITFDAPDAAARAKKQGVAQAALDAARQRPLDQQAFGKLARLRSEDPRTQALNGELPPMSREELASAYGPELAAAAFELSEAGAILPRVVETPSALHVVKLIVREREQRPAFDEVKEVLRQRLTSERRSRGRKDVVEAAVRAAGMKVDEKAIAGM